MDDAPAITHDIPNPLILSKKIPVVGGDSNVAVESPERWSLPVSQYTKGLTGLSSNSGIGFCRFFSIQ